MIDSTVESAPIQSGLHAASSIPLESCGDHAKQLEETLLSSSLCRNLQKDPTQTLSQPHVEPNNVLRQQNFIICTLTGPGMLEVPPYSWASIDKTVPTNQVTTIIFVGSNVSGYPGILHGGFLASLIDEVLARRAFPLLPSRVGATARLEINYERPAISGQLLMLKARSTRAEGREVWAEAEILALGDLKEKSGLSNVLVRADGLSMEPKNSAIVESIYKAV